MGTIPRIIPRLNIDIQKMLTIQTNKQFYLTLTWHHGWFNNSLRQIKALQETKATLTPTFCLACVAVFFPANEDFHILVTWKLKIAPINFHAARIRQNLFRLFVRTYRNGCWQATLNVLLWPKQLTFLTAHSSKTILEWTTFVFFFLFDSNSAFRTNEIA